MISLRTNHTNAAHRTDTVHCSFMCMIWFLVLSLTLFSCRTTKNYLEKDHPIAFSNSEHPNTDPDSTLSIISFNIEYGEHIEEAIKEIGSIPVDDIDVLFLQEMDEKGTALIAEQFQLNYAYFPISFHRKYKRNFGNALLSRFPLSEPYKLILPHDRPFNQMKRGATCVVITYDDNKILACSVHLETPLLSLNKRVEQLEFIINDINQRDSFDYVLLGGDFNTMFKNEVEKIMSICETQDFNWHTRGIGFTSNRWNILKPTLDHIFSRGFTHLNSGKLEKYAASDHTPIWATLNLSSNFP